MAIPVVVGAAAAIAARLAAKKAAQKVAKKAVKDKTAKIASNSVKVKRANSQGIPNSVYNKIQTSASKKMKSGENAKNRAREDASEIAYGKMAYNKKTPIVKVNSAVKSKPKTKTESKALKTANKPIKEKPLKNITRQELNDKIKKQLSNRREQDKRNYPKKAK